MLTITNLYKSYGHIPVLNGVSFSMNTGMRAGLVGTNGVGKSTLLKILAGLESIDSGKVVLSPAIRSGYLPQNLPSLTEQTIDELVMQSAGQLNEVEICEIDHEIASLMNGLGIGYLERSRYIQTLSGGEKTRVNLAIILLKSPDIMLLDEPTNNLDDECLDWLEGYLRSYKGALLVASHDRQFLNNVANLIFEIDEYTHQLKKYNGNYDDYKYAKAKERDKWEREYRSQQEEIKELRKIIKSTGRSTGYDFKVRDNDKFIKGFKRGRVDHMASRLIHNAEERLNRILDNPILRPPKPLRIQPNIQIQDIKSSEVIRITSINKSYGKRIILSDISFSLRHDSRVTIVGPNGAGKTTLIKIITGKIKPDSGDIHFSPSARLGILEQEPLLINTDKTLLEYYREGFTGIDEDFIFGLVTCGLFRYEELKKNAGQLSLGQVRKLQIARMIAAQPNVLILDEPTNHISLDVLESFEAAIGEFQGPVLAVSHDRRFIQQFNGEIWELHEGRLKVTK